MQNPLSQVMFHALDLPSTLLSLQFFCLEQIKPQDPSVCKNFAQSNDFGGSPGPENNHWDPLPCTCNSIASIPALEDIIITGVMFKPDEVNPHDEAWVEIYNNGCNIVNLFDWRFGDHSLLKTYILLWKRMMKHFVGAW
jgi:hypothetical protein